MYIAIDIGGNNVRVASSNSVTKPKLKIVKFKTSQNYDSDFANIVSAINELSCGSRSKIKGIGLSVAGLVDRNKKCLTIGVNLTSWVSKPVCKDLEKIYKCKTHIRDDAECTALGEALYGYGQKENFILVVWGTGVGGSWVQHISGKINIPLFQFGHQIIDWQLKNKCVCRQAGCIEFFCGGRYIKQTYHKRAEFLSKKDWLKVAKYMSQGLVNIILTHPVKLIIFSGGVALSQSKKLGDVEKFMRKRLKVFPMPQLKISKYKDDIALYGALGLFRNKLI